MKNFAKIKNRFLQDSLQVKLGNLASNLARLKSFSQMPNNGKVVRDLIEESKFFIEWTISGAPIAMQEKLVDLQLQLALRTYSEDRKELGEFADMWSKKILELSGLLKKGF